MKHSAAGVQLLDGGRVHLSGTALGLYSAFETRFRGMALEVGAVEQVFPNLIESRILRRAGYFDSFPEGATLALTPVQALDCSLSPAVCYHCYPALAGLASAEQTVWTCQGRCFRHESGRFEGLARLWEFTMREVVVCGPESWVRERREEWMQRIALFCREYGLTGALEESTDPFYGAASRGQRLLQQMKKLKYEMRLALPNGAATAAASFNLHGTHFTGAFAIRGEGAEPMHTGCIAFGLERWVLATLEQWDECQQNDFINQTSKL